MREIGVVKKILVAYYVRDFSSFGLLIAFLNSNVPQEPNP